MQESIKKQPHLEPTNPEKMVKVKINMITVKPEFDISMGCSGFEDLSDVERAKLGNLNVALARSKFMNSLLQPDDIVEVPESIAKAWESEVYYLPSGIFGPINASQLGIQPPRLMDGMPLDKFMGQVQEFGSEVDRKIKVKVTRATILQA